MKNSDQKPFDRVLKDQLAEGTAPVPAFVWDRIEEELFPRKKRRPFFWWFFGGFCMLSIGTCIVIAVSRQEAHSQNNALLNTRFNSDNKQVVKETQKTDILLLDPSKTKGSMQYREFRTSNDAAINFGVINPHQKSIQKTATFIPKNTGGSKSGIPIEKSGVSNFANLLTSPNSRFNPEDLKSPSEQPTVPNDSYPIAHTSPENNAKTGIDSSKSHNLSYEETAALLKRDFALPDEPAKPEHPSIFSIGIYGGPSLYNTAIFKDYFTSGQLSKRTFASSGFELGLQTRFKLGNRFRVYAGFAFNQRHTQFSYNVAITQADYFTYLANGEAVPLANIRDDGSNSCFLAKDVTVNYQMRSALISLGTSFEFLRIGKFSAAADLRLSGNLYSSLELKQVRILSIEQPASENFSYLQPGVGLSLSYRLNNRISLGLSSFFSKQFYLKESATRKLEELVIPVTVSFDF